MFDLDGTLADNMHWHARAFQAFVQRHGLPPSREATRRRIDGKRNAEIMPILFDRPLSADETPALAWEKEEMYRSLSRGALQPIRGLTTLLDALARHGIPSAVATSAPRENVAHTLGELGLADRFGAVALSDEVPRGKPFPDVYLRAAEGLGVDASTCLAFEDAPVGVAAARAAGMRCLALTSTFPAEAFRTAESPPNDVCADYEEYLAGEGQWLTAASTAGLRRAGLEPCVFPTILSVAPRRTDMVSTPGAAMMSPNTSRVLSVILGGGAGTRLFPLTRSRAKPAVPLAGKYRLVDIPISNCINSDLRRIYLLTQFNSASLHRHIAASYKFDHFSSGFVEILAAEQTYGDTSWYQGTADAVRKNLVHLLNHDFDHVLILSGDQLYRMDYRPLDRAARRVRRRRDRGHDSRAAARCDRARHPADQRGAPHHAVRREADGPGRPRRA